MQEYYINNDQIVHAWCMWLKIENDNLLKVASHVKKKHHWYLWEGNKSTKALNQCHKTTFVRLNDLNISTIMRDYQNYKVKGWQIQGMNISPFTSYNTIFLFFSLVEEGSGHKLNIFKHLPYPSQQNPQLEAVYTVPMQCCIDWTASSKSNYHQLHSYQWSQIPHTNPELSLHLLRALYYKCTLHEQVSRLKILQLYLLVLHLHLYWILFQWPKHIGRYIELL